MSVTEVRTTIGISQLNLSFKYAEKLSAAPRAPIYASIRTLDRETKGEKAIIYQIKNLIRVLGGNMKFT